MHYPARKEKINYLTENGKRQRKQSTALVWATNPCFRCHASRRPSREMHQPNYSCSGSTSNQRLALRWTTSQDIVAWRKTEGKQSRPWNSIKRSSCAILVSHSSQTQKIHRRYMLPSRYADRGATRRGDLQNPVGIPPGLRHSLPALCTVAR